MKLRDLQENQGIAASQALMRRTDLIGKAIMSQNGNDISPIIIFPTTLRHVWKGGFSCPGLNLTSLRGAPREVEKQFNASNNLLRSLEHAPAIIGGYFDVESNKLESLHDIHKIVKKIRSTVFVGGNNIKSHVMGLIYIEGCNRVEFFHGEDRHRREVNTDPLGIVNKILNRHLSKPRRSHRDVIACQSDLLDAGLDEYAQL